MSERKTYRATAERDGRFWLLRVEGIGATQARRLDQAEEMVRDLVYTLREEAPDSFDVVIAPVLEPALTELVKRAVTAKMNATMTQLEASALASEAVKGLLDAGLTFRDVGAQLDITHQRVAQILASRAAPEEGERRQHTRRTTAGLS